MVLPDGITQLLHEWSSGNQASLDELVPLVYDELHRMARRYFTRQQAAHVLQPTALLNEAYSRLVAGGVGREWKDRAHFFRAAAQAMRHVMIDYARAQRSTKRAGQHIDVELDESLAVSPARIASVVALDDALADLEILNRRQAEVVELRYFGGLTAEETAEALGVAPETVLRDWRAAKAWLHVQLSPSLARSNSKSA